MRLYKKDGDVIEIISYPFEKVYKGDYLVVEDEERDIKLLVQVIDISYIDTPGILEELIREGLIKVSDFEYRDEFEYNRSIKFLRDTKILKCMVRGAIRNGSIVRFVDDLPSRVTSRIRRLSSGELLSMINQRSKYPIELGVDLMEYKVTIDFSKLDGSLTLITGMKGSGKSHLAKLLAEAFSKYYIPYIIFDINEEYIGLGEAGLAEVLSPGKNLYFNLSYLGRETLLDVLVNVLNLPGVSANLFNEIWQYIERRGLKPTIKLLMDYIDRIVKNIMIKDALISRLMILRSCKFIKEDSIDLKELFSRRRGVVILLKDLSSVERRVLVEILLKKFSILLESSLLPPFFLFAEEAHMYIRDTFWEDIITRMRHFGLFTIFITNQPDSLDHMIFRQLDNVFIFRFLNDRDLEAISRVSSIDSSTVKSIAKDLRKGQVLIIGEVVDLFPIIVNVKSLEFNVGGKTRKVLEYISALGSNR